MLKVFANDLFKKRQLMDQSQIIHQSTPTYLKLFAKKIFQFTCQMALKKTK